MVTIVRDFQIPAALALLPAPMTSPAAMAMLLAIGLQESKFLERRQVGGPARGFWQFERAGGVREVLTHPRTMASAQHVLTELRYRHLLTLADRAKEQAVYELLEHHDVVAAAFARLLLWTVPHPLPTRLTPGAGWTQYLHAWRPGKPHAEPWPRRFEEAWSLLA